MFLLPAAAAHLALTCHWWTPRLSYSPSQSKRISYVRPFKSSADNHFAEKIPAIYACRRKKSSARTQPALKVVALQNGPL
jgi:hypothetical protein